MSSAFTNFSGTALYRAEVFTEPLASASPKQSTPTPEVRSVEINIKCSNLVSILPSLVTRVNFEMGGTYLCKTTKETYLGVTI